MLNGKTKRYDPELDKWAKSAELSITRYFELIGYAALLHPHGCYGKDIECVGEHERFFVEVERRSHMTWKEGDFPFSEVNIPERRLKTFDKSTMLFTVRYDLKKTLIVFHCDVINPVLKEHPNRYINSKELFATVDRKRCLQLDLTDHSDKRSLAEKSRENILSHWGSKTGNLFFKREVLGNREPYGMSYEEWLRLITETDKRLEECLFH